MAYRFVSTSITLMNNTHVSVAEAVDIAIQVASALETSRELS
jgi:hypothetical protein